MHKIKTLVFILFFVFTGSLFAESGLKAVYLDVTGVSEDDTLSLRASASSKAALVYSIPHDASGLLKLGSKGKWTKLSYAGHTGWAFSRYLKNSTAPTLKTVFKKEMFCFGTEPHWVLESDRQKIRFQKLDAGKNYLLDSSIQAGINVTNIHYVSAINPDVVGESLHIIIKSDEQCSDGMSDNNYPYSILVKDAGTGIRSGCCK